MLIFLMFFLICSETLAHFFGAQHSNFAAPFHEACLAIATREKLAPLSKLLLCNDSEARRQILAEAKSSGTYYLVLFSSFHVLLIEELAEMSTKYRRLTVSVAWILNIFFLLIQGAPLRLLRSLLGLLLQRGQKIWALNWTVLQVITCSGLVLLPLAIIHREQLSLLLGWIASLAARCFSRATSKETSFVKHLRIYLLLAPCLMPLALPHPFSIFVTFALGGFLPWLTLPAGLTEFALPSVHPAVALLSDALTYALAVFDRVLPLPFAPCRIPVSVLFVYLALLTGCAEWYRRHSLRSSADADEPDLLS